MKRLTPFCAAALLLGAASCSNDDMLTPIADGNVTFEVNLNGQTGSRALGDGLSATSLKYAVYDAKTDAYVMDGYQSFGNSLTTKVSLPLANGNKYKIAFFAYNNASSPYSFDFENKRVDINYSNMNSSSIKKDYDSFYKLEEVEVKGAASHTVTLTRPVAHVNWGTNDKTLDAVQKLYSSGRVYAKMTVKAYATLNLLTGEALNEETIESNTNYFAFSGEQFPVAGYEYIYTMPILVADGQQVVDAKLTVGPSKSNLIHTINVTNMPVERNYRTNVYGSLLSSTQDFNVEKEPNFDGSYSQEVWDGTTGKMPAEVEGVYTITGSDQLAAFAQEVRSGKNFSGKTVKLAADLDLNNFEWTPIGNDSKPFAGTFDGGGYTISNLSITKLNGKEHLGLFGAVKYGTIENLNVENVNIDLVSGFSGYTTADGVSAVAGELWNSSAKNVKVNNVTIKAHRRAGGIAGFAYARISDCEATNVNIALTTNQANATTWDNGDKAGAIVGYNGEGTYTITNNKVSNVTLSGYRHVGGVVGYANDQNTISGNTGSGVVIKANAEHSDSYDKGTQPSGFGLVYGYLNPSGTDSDNNVTGEVFGVNAPVQTVADLKQAIANGGYISVPASVGTLELNENVNISKPTILNIATGSILLLKSGSEIVNTSELTIGAGTVIGEYNAVQNKNGATLIIDGATIESQGTSKNNSAIYSEGDLVINNGKITANAGNALRINMANGNSGKVVVNGGEFTNHADGDYVAMFYGDVDFEINGGVYSGVFGCGLAEGGARGVIRGGTFICEGSYYGFALDPESFGKTSNVTIEGGNFYSKNATSLYARDKGSLILKGGKFNKKVTTGGPIVLANGFKLNDVDSDLTVNFDGENHTYKFVQAVVAE